MSMSFSAKRWAYSDMPSVSSQSAICCIAGFPATIGAKLCVGPQRDYTTIFHKCCADLRSLKVRPTGPATTEVSSCPAIVTHVLSKQTDQIARGRLGHHRISMISATALARRKKESKTAVP